MSQNTMLMFVGGTSLVVQGYGVEAVRIKLNKGLTDNQLVDFPLSNVPIDGVNAALVCFIAAATLTKQQLRDEGRPKLLAGPVKPSG